MNTSYSHPLPMNRATVWLLLAAAILASLLAAARPMNNLIHIEASTETTANSQVAPQVIPVPEAHLVSQVTPDVTATPFPAGAQILPVPQPVPTPAEKQGV